MECNDLFDFTAPKLPSGLAQYPVSGSSSAHTGLHVIPVCRIPSATAVRQPQNLDTNSVPLFNSRNAGNSNLTARSASEPSSCHAGMAVSCARYDPLVSPAVTLSQSLLLSSTSFASSVSSRIPAYANCSVPEISSSHNGMPASCVHMVPLVSSVTNSQNSAWLPAYQTSSGSIRNPVFPNCSVSECSSGHTGISLSFSHTAPLASWNLSIQRNACIPTATAQSSARIFCEIPVSSVCSTSRPSSGLPLQQKPCSSNLQGNTIPERILDMAPYSVSEPSSCHNQAPGSNPTPLLLMHYCT